MSHLEKELELNGSEAADKVPKNTVTQQASQQNSEKPKPTCHHCKIQVTIKISEVQNPGRRNLKNRTHTTKKLVVSRLQPNILTRNATFSLRNRDSQTGDQQKIFHQNHVLSGSNLWRYLWIVLVG